jgi:hypothetical protein
VLLFLLGWCLPSLLLLLLRYLVATVDERVERRLLTVQLRARGRGEW